MLDPAHDERKQRAFTVLALFIAVLFGQSGAAAATDLDRSAARLGQSDAVKSGAVVRTATRSATDDADADELLALLPPEPRIRRDILSVRATGEGVRHAVVPLPTRVAPAYRARAPPAA